MGNPRQPIILHIVQSLRGGGAEELVRELIPRLRVRGLDAKALCAYGNSRLTISEAESWTGSVYELNRTSKSRLKYLMQLQRLIHAIAPDIVHTHVHVGGLWGRAAAILANVQTIVHTEHRSLGRLDAFERISLAYLNRRTNATIVFSQRTADLVRRRENIRNVVVIPNGISIHEGVPSHLERISARNKLGLTGDNLIFGVVSNLYEHKNVGLAIEAIGSLEQPQRDSMGLAIFGDGPLRPVLEDRVHKLGLAPTVRFYGFRDDLPEILPGLDCLLCTSPREMMPMSLLQTMNAAVPIIGVPNLGVLDLVVPGETGIVLKSHEPVELLDAMRWVSNHPEWRIAAGLSAYNRARDNFDIEDVADKHANLYSLLLKQALRGKHSFAQTQDYRLVHESISCANDGLAHACVNC